MRKRLPGAFSSKRLPVDLGARIADARTKAGLSRVGVASAAGIAPRTLARIERGAQRPTPSTMRALVAALSLSLDAIAPAWGSDEDERVTSGALAPGVALRVLRKRQGLTQGELAAVAGVSVTTISRFERAINAPGQITAGGDHENGATGRQALAITSIELASLLGFATPAELTRACAAIDAEN